MPKLVLVAFGAVLGSGLLLFPGSARCADPDKTGPADVPSAEIETTVLLTLEDALRRSLDLSPELAASSSEVLARQSEIDQAGLFPNPELSLEIENFSGSGDFSGTDQAEITALLSQKIELGGKRRQRIAVSELDKTLVEHALAGDRARVLSSTRLLFIDLLAAQHRLDLIEEQEALAGKVLDAVNERIAAGKAPEIERLRFAPLLLETGLRKEQVRQELAAARKALAALWGEADPDFDRAQGDLLTLPEIPDWPDLTAAIDTNPEVSRHMAEVARAGRNVALEQASRIPDIALQVGGKNFEETGDHALVAGVSISMPIFDRNQGAIAAARAREARARAALRATRLQLRSELGQIWQRLQAAHAEATLLREKLLPTVRQSFDATRYGYQAGKFGYLDVLNAEQTLFAARHRYLDSVKACHQAFTELEERLGRNGTENDNTATASAVQ